MNDEWLMNFCRTLRIEGARRRATSPPHQTRPLDVRLIHYSQFIILSQPYHLTGVCQRAQHLRYGLLADRMPEVRGDFS
jgi:hypothetical protein